MEESTVSPTASSLLTGLMGDSEALDTLVTRLARTLHTRIPEYRALPMDSVKAGVAQTLKVGYSSAQRRQMPDRAELAGTVDVIVRRARSGMSLAAILDAYNLAARDFWHELTAYGRRRGASDADLLETMQVVRQWLDEVTVAAATAHHQVGVERAREDEARTGAALRELLDNPMATDAATVHLVQLGLDPSGSYAAVRGRVGEDVSAAEVRAAFSSDSSVVAVVQSDVIGLIGEPVEVSKPLGVYGIGPYKSAGELHESATAANRAFAAAAQLDRQGAHTLDQLRLAAVAATDHEMARIVGERLHAPLEAKGRYGEDIWHTVVQFLAHGLRVDDTAATMHVHPNTLRHRLGQFTALTGADLRCPADIAETWWLATVRPELGDS